MESDLSLGFATSTAPPCRPQIADDSISLHLDSGLPDSSIITNSTKQIYEKVCEMCHITVNKIAIFGDNGTITPGGVRIGTPAMTSRGCLESDFETIAEFLVRTAHITSIGQRERGKAFFQGLQCNRDILVLRNQVETFATQFACEWVLDCNS